MTPGADLSSFVPVVIGYVSQLCARTGAVNEERATDATEQSKVRLAVCMLF